MKVPVGTGRDLGQAQGPVRYEVDAKTRNTPRMRIELSSSVEVQIHSPLRGE